MPEFRYNLSLYYIDETDNENPVLIQQKMTEHGDLKDHYLRECLHERLDEIIKEFRQEQNNSS